MSPKSKAHLYRQLGQLVGTGYHLDRGVDLLLGQRPDAAAAHLLTAVKKGLADGHGLTGSLERYAGTSITDLEVSLISTGERSGRLAESCKHLADYFDTADRSRKAARSALIYPLLLAHAGAVVPALTDLVSSAISGEPKPMLPGIMMRLTMLWSAVGLLWIGWKYLAGSASNSTLADRLIRLIPWAGKVRDHWTLGRFCQVFHSALLAGISISESLRMAGRAAQSKIISAGAEHAASAVESGGTLAHSMADSGAFEKIFTDSVNTAEVTGTLDVEMERWAASETDFAISTQRHAAEMLPKIAYFIVVIYVAWGIISFFASYYGKIAEMGNSI